MNILNLKNIRRAMLALFLIFSTPAIMAQTASINIRVDKKQSTKSERRSYGPETKTIKTTNVEKNFDITVSGNGDFYIYTFIQTESKVDSSREEKTLSAREPYKYKKNASCEYETSSTRLKPGWVYTTGGNSRAKNRTKLQGDIEACVLVVAKDSDKIIASRYTTKSLYDFVIENFMEKIKSAAPTEAKNSDDS